MCSYYDTLTNVTIDDITMRMQGQTIECFAYSFVNNDLIDNSVKNTHFIGNLHKITGASSLQNNIMSTKSNVQVDCKHF